MKCKATLQSELFALPITHPHQELVIDSFAGGGGASTGIELALGKSPDIAINHCDKALAMHAQNHPDTIHLPQSVFEVDLPAYTNGRPVGFLWASPDCRHFSRASGKKILSPQVRMLAWAIVKFCQNLGRNRPRVIALENVIEFLGWGPLDSEGRPIKERAGETFNEWCAALRKLGYKIEYRKLKASDYGTPTIRTRLFVVMRRDGKKIIWPSPTHGDPRATGFASSGLRPWRTAAECIDWTIPCPSIFERKKDLAENTLKRIATGIQKFVIDAKEPFIVNMSHSGSFETLTKPMTTIKTEKGGCRALVVPFVDRQFGNSKCASVQSPLGTITTEGCGKSALITPTLIQTGYGERQGQAPRALDINTPLGTVVAGGGKHALVAAFLAQHNFDVAGRPANAPLSTITTRATQQNIVTSHLQKLKGISHSSDHRKAVHSFLTSYYGASIGQPINAPMGTVTTKDRFGLVTIEIAGEPYVVTDIGMRMLTSSELYKAQGFPEDYRINFDYQGKPFPKTEQIRKCGNSVCPPVAKAIVEANVPELMAMEEAA
ncbi:DNA cytosine methyltransferase [Pseudovibrio ascidiaceicola]|uniref:DNA cytosine methyltransferase n=1 Tax=Pseudovibrio ascidiaceicola TaxID=285279 RepID=UPI003D35BD3F